MKIIPEKHIQGMIFYRRLVNVSRINGEKTRNGMNTGNLIYFSINKTSRNETSNFQIQMFLCCPFGQPQDHVKIFYYTFHVCFTDKTIWLKTRRVLEHKQSNLRTGKHNQFLLSVKTRFKIIMLTLFSNINL